MKPLYILLILICMGCGKFNPGDKINVNGCCCIYQGAGFGDRIHVLCKDKLNRNYDIVVSENLFDKCK